MGLELARRSASASVSARHRRGEEDPVPGPSGDGGSRKDKGKSTAAGKGKSTATSAGTLTDAAAVPGSRKKATSRITSWKSERAKLRRLIRLHDGKEQESTSPCPTFPVDFLS